jgi:hypothetical protein
VARPIIGIAEDSVPAYSADANVDTTLFTYTLPANGLQFDGDSIEFEFRGHLAATAGNTSEITLTFQGHTILDSAAFKATLGGSFTLRGRIMRKSSSAVVVFVDFVSADLTAFSGDGGELVWDSTLTADLVMIGNGLTASDIARSLAVVNFRGLQP